MEPDIVEECERGSGQRQPRAAAAGDWAGCHATNWDFYTPREHGSREHTNEFTKSGYPLGITVNTQGMRFADEGADLRNYTYAAFGREVLRQPGGMAWQLWDGKTADLLREEEYRDEICPGKIVAGSIKELVERLAKEQHLERPDQLMETVNQFNDACYSHRKQFGDLSFDPSIKDGLATQSESLQLKVPKSNWALPLDEPPFVAVQITTGITFTFGGVAIDPDTAGVLKSDGSVKSANDPKWGSSADREHRKVIEGLYCAGEMVGGLFWGNYPGGSGLTAGAVFGRKAGEAAALRAHRIRERQKT